MKTSTNLDRPATMKDLQLLETRIDAKIDAAVRDISAVISSFAAQINQRLEVIEHRLDVMAIDISILKARQDKFQKDLDRLAEAAGF